MNKKILLLSQVLLLAIVGCNFNNNPSSSIEASSTSGSQQASSEPVNTIRINNYLNTNEENIQVLGKDLDLVSYDTIKAEYDAKVTEINNNLENEDIYANELADKLVSFNDYIEVIQTQMNYYNIYKDTFEDSQYEDSYDSFYELYIDAYNQYTNFLVKSASTKYRRYIFNGYSDAEIEAYVNSNNEETQQEIKQADLKLVEIQDNFTALNDNFTSTTAAQYLLEYVGVANEYASLFGYSNYLDYSYENNYGREYTYEDSHKIYNYMKKYNISQLTTEYYTSLSSSYKKLTTSEKKVYKKLIDNFFGDTKAYIDNYATYMGSSFLTHYTNLWESGNYFYSDINDGSMTAYQYQYSNSGDKYLFFGAGYQGARTFIHEFGHYNAAYSNTISSFDLMETQSQGDEILFANYLMQKENGLSDNLKNTFASYVKYILASTMVSACAVNEIEIYAYLNPTITPAQLVSYANSICSNLNTSNEYWQYTAIYSPCYYISYSTSAFSALSVQYLVDTYGLDGAKEKYLKVVNYPNRCSSYTDVLNYSGLLSPFVESNYSKLA